MTAAKSGSKGGRPRKDGPRDAAGRLIRKERLAGKAFTQPIGAEHGLPLQVEQMVAAGERRETIARAVGCTVAELEVRFADELEHGAARRRAEIIDIMWRKAREGHPGSIKELVEMTGAAVAERSFLDGADATDEDDEPSAQPAARRRRLGKKEQALVDAEGAGSGTEWGDDLAPPKETLQ
ncbi:hypothetical protein A5481_06170 [Methylobacterium platani]|uniref:Uncharacterized protein n=1 Tax=Methylobacterium platani TaxID=427683 RepID=A0A179SEK2_9HYPH|nr:hypothetical protein A5481_06170 [Methylobacterium platani]